MGLFDVHAHLTHPQMPVEADEAVARARAAGLTTIVVNGLHPADNLAVRALARRHPEVKAALGFYPVEAVRLAMAANGQDVPGEKELAVAPEEGIASVLDGLGEAVAVGEIGLDGYWVPPAYWDAQEAVFRRLVRAAMDADLPVIIHSRKREERTFEVLSEMGATKVNWHCFGGRVKLAVRIAAAGHRLSLPANLHRSQSFQRMVDLLPRDALLTETDCPFLGPEVGIPSTPADVSRTVDTLAAMWGVSRTQAIDQLASNFEGLFGFPP